MPRGPPTVALNASSCWVQLNFPLNPSSPALTAIRPLNSQSRRLARTSLRVSQLSSTGRSALCRVVAQPASTSSANSSPSERKSGIISKQAVPHILEQWTVGLLFFSFKQPLHRFVLATERNQRFDDVGGNLMILHALVGTLQLDQRLLVPFELEKHPTQAVDDRRTCGVISQCLANQ